MPSPTCQRGKIKVVIVAHTHLSNLSFWLQPHFTPAILAVLVVNGSCPPPHTPILLTAVTLHSSAIGHAGYEMVTPMYQPRNTGTYSPKHWCVSAQHTGTYQVTLSKLRCVLCARGSCLKITEATPHRKW